MIPPDIKSTKSLGAGNRDLYLVKTDSQGTQEWYQAFGGTGHEFGHSVKQTADGGDTISGETSSFGSGNIDIFRKNRCTWQS